jgi:nifR3 family TIM-barrel protein
MGAQLWGGDPRLAGPAAKRIEELGFDVVDLNCGCPVKKVTKHGCGSSLLKTPERIGEIVANMVAAVNIPVTVKVRIGWDNSSVNIAEVTRVAEEAGAKIISVHGRTRAQGYRGTVDYDAIRKSKEAAKNILVFGNGDIYDPLSAKRMFEETGCDGLLLARGLLGRPWLIEEIERALNNEDPFLLTGQQLKESETDAYAFRARHFY